MSLALLPDPKQNANGVFGYLTLFLQEYPGEIFPPWAHGPGYIISSDIAKFVSEVSDSPQLQVGLLPDSSWMPSSSSVELCYMYSGNRL